MALIFQAISQGEVILVVVALATPVAALLFILGAGPALEQVGKGRLAIDQDLPQPRPTGALARSRPETQAESAEREAEVRQMLEAKAYRQRRRGEAPIDVEVEAGRLLSPPGGSAASKRAGVQRARRDPELMEEVRAHVVARNERRMARGEAPLDVESEVTRQLESLA